MPKYLWKRWLVQLNKWHIPVIFQVFFLNRSYLSWFLADPAKTWRSRSITSQFFCVHYDIDRSDIDKNQDTIRFFNYNLSSNDKHFLGTPVTTIPAFSPFLDDEVKIFMTMHVCKKSMMGRKTQSICITGVQLKNWEDSNKRHTLHQQLMAVESIYDKTVINSKTKIFFSGRLFYAIALN